MPLGSSLSYAGSQVFHNVPIPIISALPSFQRLCQDLEWEMHSKLLAKILRDRKIIHTLYFFYFIIQTLLLFRGDGWEAKVWDYRQGETSEGKEIKRKEKWEHCGKLFPPSLLKPLLLHFLVAYIFSLLTPHFRFLICLFTSTLSCQEQTKEIA